MNVAWIVPQKGRCGIALYAARYVEALRRHASVETLDPSAFPSDPDEFLSCVNKCDLAHIQYDPSFFRAHHGDFYARLCTGITVPIVVTMHEVYRSFPDVYPREAIRGNGPLAVLRRMIYDRRHPLQKTYLQHASESFYASLLLTHCDFQNDILIEQGCDGRICRRLEYPVVPDPEATVGSSAGRKTLRIAASGFINPHFDYDLLFATLDRLDVPWTFTWIGGIRRDEDASLLRKIDDQRIQRGWRERFIVTGWVDDAQLQAHLRDADILCAFFTSRSSSGSLAAAFGSLRPVIALPIPLTEEFARVGLLHLAPADPVQLAEGIGRLHGESALRSSLVEKMAAYRERNSYPVLAKKLVEYYAAALDARQSTGGRP